MSNLIIKSLTKYYKKNLGVEDINIELNKGEMFGFIGPNGAGKSTTIKCIMNELKYEGIITFNGNDVNSKKEDIGYLPSEVSLYKEMKVKDIIKYNDSFYKFDTLKKANNLLKRLKLEENKKIEELSLGNLKKIGIVLSLCHNPKLVIMDEATSGLDPLIQEELFKILKEEKLKGTTILFSSHNLSEVEKICDRVGIIKKGKIIKVETIEDIKNKKLVNIYIKAKEIKKIILPVNNMKIYKQTDDELYFSYNGSVNTLLDKIKTIQIEKLLIEEPSLEEIFMHYYKEN